MPPFFPYSQGSHDHSPVHLHSKQLSLPEGPRHHPRQSQPFSLASVGAGGHLDGGGLAAATASDHAHNQVRLEQGEELGGRREEVSQEDGG